MGKWMDRIAKRYWGADSGSRPTGQAASRLDASRFDPGEGECPVCKHGLTKTAGLGSFCANLSCPVFDDWFHWKADGTRKALRPLWTTARHHFWLGRDG